MLISQAKVVQGERRTKKNLFLFALPSRLFGVAPPCNSCFDGYSPKGIEMPWPDTGFFSAANIPPMNESQIVHR